MEKQRKADFDKLVSACDKTEITGRRGTTNYKFVGKVGHSASYWRSLGWHGRFHEPFANVTALISFRNHEPAYMKAMNIFKGFGKAIAKDFYGIELD